MEGDAPQLAMPATSRHAQGRTSSGAGPHAIVQATPASGMMAAMMAPCGYTHAPTHEAQMAAVHPSMAVGGQPMHFHPGGSGSGTGAATVYAFPVHPHSGLSMQPHPSNMGIMGGDMMREYRDLSPRSMRKASHNAVEVRRRRRISQQLDRLKAMLNCQKVDKASLLSEAVSRIQMLTTRCHHLETELAHMKGQPPPPPFSVAAEESSGLSSTATRARVCFSMVPTW